MAGGFALPSRTPTLLFPLHSPSTWPSFTLSSSVFLILFRPVSHRCTLITSLSSRLILALFPCPIVYTPTVACSFKFRTSQPVTGVRPRLSSGTAPVTGIENVLTGVLERRLTFVPCYAAVFVLDFYGRVSRGKSREICASFVKERTR